MIHKYASELYVVNEYEGLQLDCPDQGAIGGTYSAAGSELAELCVGCVGGMCWWNVWWNVLLEWFGGMFWWNVLVECFGGMCWCLVECVSGMCKWNVLVECFARMLVE